MASNKTSVSNKYKRSTIPSKSHPNIVSCNEDKQPHKKPADDRFMKTSSQQDQENNRPIPTAHTIIASTMPQLDQQFTPKEPPSVDDATKQPLQPSNINHSNSSSSNAEGGRVNSFHHTNSTNSLNNNTHEQIDTDYYSHLIYNQGEQPVMKSGKTVLVVAECSLSSTIDDTTFLTDENEELLYQMVQEGQ